MLVLLGVHIDPTLAKAWRASVKALGERQGPAMEEALRLWLAKHHTKVSQVMQPTKVSQVMQPTSPTVKIAGAA